MLKSLSRFLHKRSWSPPRNRSVLNLVELEDRRTPSATTDLVAQSLAWNVAQNGVTAEYAVEGSALTKTVTGGFYWASGPTWAQHIGNPAKQINLTSAIGDYTVTITSSMLASRPSNGTFLVFVVDPLNQIAETNESNNSVAVAVPDIAIQSITTTDSRSVTVTYSVSVVSLPEVPLGLYRGNSATFTTSDQSFAPVTELPGGLGSHTVTISLSKAMLIDPANPYVLAQIDPGKVIPETSATNNTASFRTRFLGVVTHGFNLFGGLSFDSPTWITTMANELKAEGYDDTIAFNWTALSNLPVPGMVDLAASELVSQIDSTLARMKALYPNDVIDVMMIGHSRGADVVTEAASMLQGNAIVNQGTLQLALLDPHPATNLYGQTFSAAPFVGYPFQEALIGFQSLADDPPVVIPPNVDIVDDYYQTTPWYEAAFGSGEHILNLWGNVPITDNSTAVVQYHNLTGWGMSHGAVITWYTDNVVPLLRNGVA
jgi:hypothetical protein